MLPVLFLSHGSPMTAIENSPAHRFLTGLGATLPRPKAVLAVSAHWETNIPAVSTTPRNSTIHDFYGFPPALYQLHYNAPGAPEVAARVAELLAEAGFPVGADPARGLDHGAWVPMLLAWPEADIPVLQLSVQTHLGAAHHLKLGAALAKLRAEDVLVMASGAYTHDLRRFRRGVDFAAPESPDVTEFSDWMHEKIMAMDFDALADYRRLCPHAADEHPTDEHLLPLHVALGAAGRDAKPERIHSSVEYGFLRMDSYAFA